MVAMEMRHACVWRHCSELNELFIVGLLEINEIRMPITGIGANLSYFIFDFILENFIFYFIIVIFKYCLILIFCLLIFLFIYLLIYLLSINMLIYLFVLFLFILMDAFCKDAPCMIVAVDTQVGVAWLIDFYKRVW